MIPGFDLILLETTAEISDRARSLLEIENGDRIGVSYINDGSFLLPILTKSSLGNKLSKSNTFSFRGKQKEMLSQYGDKFIIEEKGGNLVLKGNGEVIYTSVKKAVEEHEKRYISEEILNDKNYNIQKFDYEL